MFRAIEIIFCMSRLNFWRKTVSTWSRVRLPHGMALFFFIWGNLIDHETNECHEFVDYIPDLISLYKILLNRAVTIFNPPEIRCGDRAGGIRKLES